MNRLNVNMYIAFIEGNINGFEMINKEIKLSEDYIQAHLNIIKDNLKKLKLEVNK